MEDRILLVFLAMSAVVGAFPKTNKTLCVPRDSTYYDIGLGRCAECSVCGNNEVIRTPCSALSDTVCGPFLEFHRFHQSPYVNLVPNANDTRRQEGNDVLQFVPKEGSSKTRPHPPSSKDQPVTLQTGKWYKLAMILLGILCVIAVFIIIYIVVVCFCRKQGAEKQAINCHTSASYTPVRTHRESYIPARSRNSIDEESEDSSGARMILVPNAPYDGDLSGIPTPSNSTNYVYFIAPSKGTDT